MAAPMSNAAAATYRTRPIKRRQRRTKAQIAEIRDAMYAVLEDDHPQTVRQVFYRLTSVGAIEKTEAEYKGTVCRLLADMRRDATVPYGWLADSTRWMRRPETYSSMEEALQRTAATYRRSLWEDATEQVEVWLEKEALAGVLAEVTVPVGRTADGRPRAIAARWDRSRQRTHIYYLGDRDPSGVDIDRAIRRNIGESLLVIYGLVGQFSPEAMFDDFADFARIAVTPEQVIDLGLPGRPTKKTDTRSKNFDGDSVEVDAIPAHLLREIAEDAITAHVDHRKFEILQKVEAEEHVGLERLAVAGAGEVS
jgi:hypothetical protein